MGEGGYTFITMSPLREGLISEGVRAKMMFWK